MLIKDKQIRALTDKLERAEAPRIDDANLIDILAAVGDFSDFWRNENEMREKLSAPGITRHEQLELVREGMDSAERGDLERILDESGFSMTASAKNFLEALVGRAPLDEDQGPLELTADQRNGFVGRAEAGDVIEAINLSAAPLARLHLDNTTEIARADQFGKFAGTLPDVKEGDIVRLRTRKADGTVSDWVTIRATGLSPEDTREAQINLERLDLVAQSGGGIEVTQNTARPLTEPGATVRITNARTGERFEFVATDEGALPDGFALRGRAGDEFKVAVSDGHWNLSFANVAGVLKVPGGDNGPVGVDVEDPAAQKRHLKPDGTNRYEKVRYTGPLFVDGPSASDVRQGAIGNCYFPSAMAAVAYTDPGIIENMIRDNEDGTYTVTFQNVSWSGATDEVEILIDADLYTRSWGGPIYGVARNGSNKPDKMELWFPLIEKAFAKWKGSYETIGEGGVAGKVLEAVTGKSYDYQFISPSSKDLVYRRIAEAAEKGWPACAGTHGKDRAELYTNTGVYANHSYSVLGVEEEAGVRYVKLRNPWGQSEAGNDGQNDGFFRLELDKFVELYGNLAVCPA